MQALRTIGWVAITIILVAFIAINWTPTRVNIWPQEQGYLYFEWPVGVVALVAYALGFLPIWLYHRTARWRYNRRINVLESSVRAASTPPPSPSETDEPTFTA
jgi:uncharacterized integral membrane protein